MLQKNKMAYAIPTADMQQPSSFPTTTTTQPTSNRHLLSPHDSKTQHRKFPSGTIMLPPTGLNALPFPVFARQHSSSMDYTKTGSSRSLQESPQFQPSSPINRSPMQSPLASPRTLLYPTLDRIASGNGVRVGSASATTTPRSNTPNYLPSQDELTLQNIRLTLNKCKQMGIMNDQQIEVFLQTYSNL